MAAALEDDELEASSRVICFGCSIAKVSVMSEALRWNPNQSTE